MKPHPYSDECAFGNCNDCAPIFNMKRAVRGSLDPLTPEHPPPAREECICP